MTSYKPGNEYHGKLILSKLTKLGKNVYYRVKCLQCDSVYVILERSIALRNRCKKCVTKEDKHGGNWY